MYQRLFVPVDGSELSGRAMQASVDLARQLNAEIVGFVVEPEAPLPTVGTQLSSYERETEAHVMRTDTHAHDVLTRFQERAAVSGVAFSGIHVHTAVVGQAIAEHALDQCCDMIVMVTHGRGIFGELFFGSYTKDVMGRSKLPLLILH